MSNLDISDEAVVQVLGEKRSYAKSLTDLLAGYRTTVEQLRAHPSFAGDPDLIEVSVWSVLTDDEGDFHRPGGTPWKYHHLCNLLVSALERITALEDLNEAGLDGNRRSRIR